MERFFNHLIHIVINFELQFKSNIRPFYNKTKGFIAQLTKQVQQGIIQTGDYFCQYEP